MGELTAGTVVDGGFTRRSLRYLKKRSAYTDVLLRVVYLSGANYFKRKKKILRKYRVVIIIKSNVRLITAIIVFSRVDGQQQLLFRNDV